MKVRLFFSWLDFWVGVSFDRRYLTFYVCLIPMIVIKLSVFRSLVCDRDVRGRHRPPGNHAVFRGANPGNCHSCGKPLPRYMVKERGSP